MSSSASDYADAPEHQQLPEAPNPVTYKHAISWFLRAVQMPKARYNEALEHFLSLHELDPKYKKAIGTFLRAIKTPKYSNQEIEEIIASHAPPVLLAKACRLNKARLAIYEPRLYQDVCIKDDHANRLMSFFVAVMKKPKRAGWVKTFEFGRDELEGLCVDEDEEGPQTMKEGGLGGVEARGVKKIGADEKEVLGKMNKQTPKPSRLSSGSSPLPSYAVNPSDPIKEISKLWKDGTIGGAVQHAYPSLARSDINMWQSFLYGNTEECRLGLLLQLMPNLTGLKLDVTGIPNQWPTSLVGLTLGCAPEAYKPRDGLQALGIQRFEKLTHMELRGPGFTMRAPYDDKRIVCKIRLSLQASLQTLRLFGVEVTEVYMPDDVPTVSVLVDLKMVNVAIETPVIKQAVLLAPNLKRLHLDRLKRPYKIRVQNWKTPNEYEALEEMLEDLRPDLGPEYSDSEEEEDDDISDDSDYKTCIS